VLGHVYDIAEGIAVDTHVLRVSNRLGIARGDDPIEVERQLMTIIPKERWTRTTDLIIFHGRKICDARRPLCGQCPVFAPLPLAVPPGLRARQAAQGQGRAGQRRPPAREGPPPAARR
jgi:endonuclease-3